MNRSMTNQSHAHTVRVDAFVAQMHQTERAKLAQAIDRQNVAELERAAIAHRIKQARLEAGLSQPEMAEALGVIDRTYQNYESVKKPRIPWGSMNDIAKISGKSTEWLIHGDGVATPEPFAGQPIDPTEQLNRIEQALTTRTDHDEKIAALIEQQNQLLERQSDILKRIETLVLALPTDEQTEALLRAARGEDQPDPQSTHVPGQSEPGSKARRLGEG